MKYVPEDTTITFSEIPGEISLCINISGCPCHCEGCHSSYLANDIGEELNERIVDELINKNPGISCVAFMGGDGNPKYINHLANQIKEHYPELKVAWYSGRDYLSPYIETSNFNYIKIGPYIKEFGPLNSKTTNQRMYKWMEDYSFASKIKKRILPGWLDITKKFYE